VLVVTGAGDAVTFGVACGAGDAAPPQAAASTRADVSTMSSVRRNT
jgi:hypothetical protein